jgi:phage-related baseplate assembly protein
MTTPAITFSEDQAEAWDAVAAALEAVTEYVQDDLAVGRVVRLTALLARLHQSGVETVTLTAPTADIDPGRTGIARATSITLTVEVMP